MRRSATPRFTQSIGAIEPERPGASPVEHAKPTRVAGPRGESCAPLCFGRVAQVKNWLGCKVPRGAAGGAPTPSVFEAHQDRLTAATPALLPARGRRSDLVFKQEQPARRARRVVRQPSERGGGARPHLGVGHRCRDGHVGARGQCPMPLDLQRAHRLLGRRASHEHGIHVHCTPGAAAPSRQRTRASCLACSAPPLHPTRT